MKTLIATFLLYVPVAFGQNLIPNGDFESMNFCPNNYNQVEAATGWYRSPDNANPNYSTEYMNSCNSGLFNVPNGTWGYQPSHSGSGYMALNPLAPGVSTNYRENIYTALSSPLVIGQTYEVSYYASRVNNCKHAANNLGAKFSTVVSFPVNNTAHMNSSNIITDTVSWTLVTGTFVADSAYTYISIGNFYTDNNTLTTTVCSSCAFVQHAYFIDDVSVTRVSLAGVDEQDDLLIEAYPNPGTGEIRFVLPGGEAFSVEVRDAPGALVLSDSISMNDPVVGFDSCPAGIYFIMVTDRNGRSKVIKYIKNA